MSKKRKKCIFIFVFVMFEKAQEKNRKTWKRISSKKVFLGGCEEKKSFM